MSARDSSPGNVTVRLVDRHLRSGAGERIAVLEPDRPPLSYEQLWSSMGRVASFLGAAGVRPGDRVALLLADSREFVFAFLGCSRIGAVAVPLNPGCDAELLQHFLADSGSVLLFTGGRCRELASALRRDSLPSLRDVVDVDASPWDGFPETREPRATRGDDEAFWLYTSGTTGAPKAAVHSHAAIHACVDGYAEDVLSIEPGDVAFSTSKLFFAYGLGNSLLFPLAAGATAVLNPERCDAATVARIAGEFSPTLFFSVPTLYSRYLDRPETITREGLGSVRRFVSAGEYLPAEVFERWLERTGRPILDGIGTTEAMHIFCSNRPGRLRAGTSGCPVRGYDLRIAGDDGEPVRRGEIGHLLVRGASTCLGYRIGGRLERSSHDGEWLRTGDLYSQDDDGFFVYEGRRGDSFKSAGLWVSPVKIERALLESEDVREAVVIAAPGSDGILGPKAFVVPAEPARSHAPGRLVERLRDRLCERLARHEVPHAIEVVGDLPRTATGKVARRSLPGLEPIPDPDPPAVQRFGGARPSRAPGCLDREPAKERSCP